MRTSPKILVLCVDDHPMAREGLAAMIQTQPDLEALPGAGSGEEAIRLFEQYRPDITLMDLRLPGLSGIQTIRAIRGRYPNARFIVITSFTGDENIHRALEAGAQAYLLKECVREEIVSAIRAVHRGERYISPTVAAQLAAHLPRVELSARELEVLDCLAKGMSNKETAFTLNISEFTVKAHVKNLMSKLGANDRTHAVMMAIERGLIFTKA